MLAVLPDFGAVNGYRYGSCLCVAVTHGQCRQHLPARGRFQDLYTGF